MSMWMRYCCKTLHHHVTHCEASKWLRLVGYRNAFAKRGHVIVGASCQGSELQKCQPGRRRQRNWTLRMLVNAWASGQQSCRYSRNIAQVTPKIIYLHYQNMYLSDQRIQKQNNSILKKTSLAERIRDGRDCLDKPIVKCKIRTENTRVQWNNCFELISVST